MRDNPRPPSDALQGKSERVKSTCDNCGKRWPRLNPETQKPWKKNKRFCDDECKTEFHKHGSAFGPLKDTVVRIAAEQARKASRVTDEALAGVLATIERMSEELTAMHARIEGFAKQISQVPRLSREIDDARTDLEAVKLSLAAIRTRDAFEGMIPNAQGLSFLTPRVAPGQVIADKSTATKTKAHSTKK